MHVVASIVAEFNYDFGRDGFVVPDGEGVVGEVASAVEGSSVIRYFISRYIKGVSSIQCYLLVFGGVVDAVFANKFQRTIS